MEWFAPVVDLIVQEFNPPGSDADKHVLVFGSSGVGKTSFINALTGGTMPTGSGARGVTLESHEFRTSRDGVDYRIVDTAGLNEADRGTVSGIDAVKGLVRLLKRTEGGLNLAIMVVPKGRIHASMMGNYKLFVEEMMSNMVPLVIVVTHCEREGGDMQGWVRDNKQDFLSRGISAQKMVATTFISPNPEIDNVAAMNTKVELSVELSWDAIRRYATAQRVDFMGQGGGFQETARKMYNSVARRIGTGAVWVSSAFVRLIQRVVGLDERAAKRAAREVIAHG
ncbi:unnamed protein product [Ectocarpus sp. 12 AP-2014]